MQGMTPNKHQMSGANFLWPVIFVHFIQRYSVCSRESIILQFTLVFSFLFLILLFGQGYWNYVSTSFAVFLPLYYYMRNFLQFDWLRAVVFQLFFEIPTCENYKSFSSLSSIKNNGMICTWYLRKYHSWYFKIVPYNHFEWSLVVFEFMPTTNNTITYTNF